MGMEAVMQELIRMLNQQAPPEDEGDWLLDTKEAGDDAV